VVEIVVGMVITITGSVFVEVVVVELVVVVVDIVVVVDRVVVIGTDKMSNLSHNPQLNYLSYYRLTLIMPFKFGSDKVKEEIVGGLTLGTLMPAMVALGVPLSWIFVIKLVGVLGTALVLYTMPTWGFLQLLGWLVTVILLSGSGLISTLELIVFILIPLIVLGLKISKSF